MYPWLPVLLLRQNCVKCLKVKIMDLHSLEQTVARDLKKIAHPHNAWVLPRTTPDDHQVLNVLVVGAGQSGIAAAFGLQRARIDKVLVIDQAPYGQEGPWATYARMHTLRNPKDYTGPDLDVPSLTCQSWYEARFGAQAWTDLEMLPRALWGEYLLWVRKMSGVTVENETTLLSLVPDGDLIVATLMHDGVSRVVYARKIVLATGQESLGRWGIPKLIEALPATMRARAADQIDFAVLKGKSVTVIGAGASAFDNAATALEAGASDVRLLCRRLEPQVVQPYRWLTFRGFLRHFSDLSDAWRWRFMDRIFSLREGFTQATYERCMMHPQFEVITGAVLTGAGSEGGRVRLETGAGLIETDFVIAATGIDIDMARRPELSAAVSNIATWADCYTPPEDERNDRLGAFPYLREDYSFTELTPGLTPWINNVHLFSIASSMSFGPSGSSINAMTTAIPKLVAGIGRTLFCEDIEEYWESLKAYDVPQAVLRSR